MSERHLLAFNDEKCNSSDPSTTCTDSHSVGLSLKALALGIIFIAALIMNGTVSLVFYKKSQLLSVSNIFVLNLICCQLVVCTVVLPFTISSTFLMRWVFDDAWCHIQGFILTICVVATQLSLTVIAIDRNYAIINSLRYPYVFTQKRCKMCLLVLWILSLTISIPPLAGFGRYVYSNDQNTCLIDWKYSVYYTTIFISVSFVAPLLVQSWCYLTIFKAAMNHTKRSIRVYPSSTSTAIRERDSTSTSEITSTQELSAADVQITYKSMECKAIRTILFIAGSYALCWVPFMITAFYGIRGIEVTYEIGSLTIVMLFLNTCIDPLIYAFMNRIMRFEIYKFYCDSLSKMGTRSSSFENSEEMISSTYLSQSQNTSRLSRGSSLRSRGAKSAIQKIEMDTIREERESNHEPLKARCEIVLTPHGLKSRQNAKRSGSSSINFQTRADIHPTKRRKSSKHKPKRSKSEIWNSKEKYVVSEQDSFLFFKLKQSERRSKSAECLSRKKTIRTVCEQTLLPTSAIVHNETEIDLNEYAIVAELSIDVRKKKRDTKEKLILETV